MQVQGKGLGLSWRKDGKQVEGPGVFVPIKLPKHYCLMGFQENAMLFYQPKKI